MSSCAASAAIAQQGGSPFESVTVESEWQSGLPDGDNALPQLIAPVQLSDIRQQAQPEISSVTTEQNTFEQTAVTIGAVNVRTESDIPTSGLASAYEEFIGQSADQTTLKALAASVSAAARREGYLFASAQIPKQAVEVGIVTVQLDPGGIDEVRIIGSDNKRLRKILDTLVCEAAQSQIVERQLLLAGDLPDITIKDSSYVRENGKGILVVKVTENRVKAYASLDNYGPNTLGPVRARLKVDYSGILFDDDILTVNVINTIAQPRELGFINARYARTLGDGRTVVGISASAGQTRSGGRLSGFDYTGRNRYAALFFSRSLARSRKFNLWLNGEFAYLDVEQSQADALFQNDEIVTASLNFAGNYDIGMGRIYGGIGVTRGFDILGASKAGDPLNSRPNADGTFTKANIWVNSILRFGDGFGARLAGNGQISSDPLLAPFEIAIGGPNYGRGFDFSERFGDEGVLGLAELRKEFKDVTNWLDWFQLYGFVDGGYVSNIGTGFGDGSLASAGGGVRANLGRVNLDVQAAAPLNSDRFESNDRSPKLLFQLGTAF